MLTLHHPGIVTSVSAADPSTSKLSQVQPSIQLCGLLRGGENSGDEITCDIRQWMCVLARLWYQDHQFTTSLWGQWTVLISLLFTILLCPNCICFSRPDHWINANRYCISDTLHYHRKKLSVLTTCPCPFLLSQSWRTAKDFSATLSSHYFSVFLSLKQVFFEDLTILRKYSNKQTFP